MINQIIILGSGGHAQVIASEIIKSKKYELLGFIDNNLKKKVILSYKKKKYKIIASFSEIKKFKNNKIGFVCAIGDINERHKIVSNLNKKYSKLNWLNVISDDSNIDESVNIGEGNMIISGATVNVNSLIGNHNIINTNSSVDHNCKIGSYINISPGVNIAGSVEIKDKSFIGMNSSIKEKIIVEKNVIIGANSYVNIKCQQNNKYYGLPLRKVND